MVGESKDSDYAATRDFTDWLGQQGEKWKNMAAQRHVDDGRFDVDPVAALRFIRAVQQRLQLLADHFVPQVEAKKKALQENFHANLDAMNALLPKCANEDD